MVDKRSLRSSKPDATASSDGNKAAAPTKPAPTRTPSSRAKAGTTKRTTLTHANGSADEPPHTNGVDPVEKGVNGDSPDVEMGDEASDPTRRSRSGKDQDGDDEMTVVVPPAKDSKPAPGKDQEGDVVMNGAPKVPEAESDAPDEGTVDPTLKAISDIKSNFPLLERAVAQFDARFSLRVLRSMSSIRKHLTPDILARVITETYAQQHSHASFLLGALGKTHPGTEMEVDGEPKPKPAPAPSASKAAVARDVLPEVDIYLAILMQIHLLDSNAIAAGAEFSRALVQRIHALNRRTLDSLAARVYFYHSLFHEQLAPLPPSPLSPVVPIRQQLLAALRTAVLRKDTDTQATVTTLLLRNYLSTSHISQADLLVSHTQFPPTASNNQIARYLYYLGRIRAIQLSYTEAQEHLTGATRKSPSSASAAGFYQASTKLLIVVELLMGDIPDRAVFRQPSLERALQPYFLLVQGVRVGDLESFLHTVQTHSATFRRDGTYTLILRLRQNVIKTGIRMMSLSYSRISLRDICVRLSLDSEESAEYIVAKAIRDGVIEATLDHERGFMKSKELGDIYATREPGEAFHDRIRACLGLHDESVKAMRFPMNQHRLELKNAQEARERERELAKEIQEGDIDEDDAGGDFEGM
ncbi:MAG: 26S proteasome non-ATPase regulatory subunit [Thelocarpon superellum]|nr:MAG: 26S proteasome non-ATPase regulatory subunit [Thelocarpon superellum]